MQGFDLSIPPICPRCEIAIYPGTTHDTIQGCLIALKAFVKLCQDEIESTRMRDFQHPTREELMAGMLEMETQFNKLASYSEVLAEYLQKLLHGKI